MTCIKINLAKINILTELEYLRNNTYLGILLISLDIKHKPITLVYQQYQQVQILRLHCLHYTDK